MNLPAKFKGVIFSSITAILWGFLAIALKVSLTDLRPVDITWVRFSIAFIVLAAFLLVTNQSQFKIIKSPPPLLIIAALCLGFNYLGFISGVNFTSPGISQVFIQLGPVLLALAGFIIYKERVNLPQLIGLIMVVSGLVLFYREQLSFITGHKDIFNRGIAWIIFGAIAWAGYAISQKKLVQTYPPMQLNLIIFGLPAVLYSPFANYSSLLDISLKYWLLIIFLGLNTLAAYGSLAIALKYLAANKVSVIITQNPVITFITMAILGALEVSWIMPENFTFLTIIGAMFVIIGAVLTVFMANKRT
jgi:drug/metabolite transporter (DMT)-like permease